MYEMSERAKELIERDGPKTKEETIFLLEELNRALDEVDAILQRRETYLNSLIV